jgi:hypothetical protein
MNNREIADDMPDQVQQSLDGIASELEETHNVATWPAPTVERPDWQTIEEWLWEDGGCETTDGCWVEPDATCQHGHPSWLLKLGMI